MNATVIINTINENPDVLNRCVDSYRNQFDQIIISTIEDDPSIGYLKDVQFAIVKKADHVGRSARGAYQQINEALKLFNTDYLCYASGNDYAEPDKAIREIKALKQSGKKVCYSAFWDVKDGVKSSRKFHDYDFTTHLSGNFVSDCSMMTKEIVLKYLPYNIGLNNFAHWDSWLRIYEGEGNVFVYNPIPTWNYIHNENDMSKERQRDPEKILKNYNDRKRMLNLHR